MTNLRYKFKNGVVVETNNIQHLQKVAESFGETLNLKGWHWSESKQEFVLVKNMHTSHIRNAIVKEILDNFANSKGMTDKEFATLLLLTTTTSDLVNEFLDRIVGGMKV